MRSTAPRVSASATGNSRLRRPRSYHKPSVIYRMKDWKSCVRILTCPTMNRLFHVYVLTFKCNTSAVELPCGQLAGFADADRGRSGWHARTSSRPMHLEEVIAATGNPVTVVSSCPADAVPGSGRRTRATCPFRRTFGLEPRALIRHAGLKRFLSGLPRSPGGGRRLPRSRLRRGSVWRVPRRGRRSGS